MRFHVDGVMSSHTCKRVNLLFERWLNDRYGKFGPVTTTQGKVHDYLGMTFDFGEKGKVKIDMIKNVKRMIEDFKAKYKLDGITDNAAAPDLFKIGSGELLKEDQKEDFHTFVAKGLFCGKRA